MLLSKENFKLAQAAHDYVSKTVCLGASNKPHLKNEDGTEKKYLGLNAFKAVTLNRLATEVGTSYTLSYLGLFSDLVKAHKSESMLGSTIGVETTCLSTQFFKAGNCQEQAALAYKFLSNKGVYPLEICHIKEGDHVFVIIGRDQNSNIKDPSSWGESAVICDPWSQNHYAKDYRKWLIQMDRPLELIKNIEVLHSRPPSQLGYLTRSTLESSSFLLLRNYFNTFLSNGSLNLSGQNLFFISIGLTSMLRSIKQLNQVKPEYDNEAGSQLTPPTI